MCLLYLLVLIKNIQYLIPYRFQCTRTVPCQFQGEAVVDSKETVEGARRVEDMTKLNSKNGYIRPVS